MSLCVICFLNKLYGSHQHVVTVSLTAELEDSRRFTLNAITVLLAVLAASGSRVLQPVTLPLLMYTINLRLATNSCFLHNCPTLSRFLHFIPLLGTSCMAGVALVVDLQSPSAATVGIVLGTLPLLTLVIYHGNWCGETSATGLPMQMQDIRAPATLGASGTTGVEDPGVTTSAGNTV